MSFTRAAEEFHVTQGAVSRQIKLLENALGFALFKRLHRAIELTPQGRQFYQAVTMALAHVDTTIDTIVDTYSSQLMTVAATHAVSTYWLMPRIPKLRSQFPDFDIQVLATDSELSELSGSFDVGIRYGDGKWPGVKSISLGTSEVFPVCSPAYAQSHSLEIVKDLLDESLLYLDDDRQAWVDWPYWFKQLGVNEAYPKPALRANSYMILQQAAIDGQGIALGWEHLVGEALQSGVLMRPISAKIESPQGFYLTVVEESETNNDIDALTNWFVSEFKLSS